VTSGWLGWAPRKCSWPIPGTATNTDAERQAQMFLQPRRYKADTDTDAEAAAALTDADLHALRFELVGDLGEN